MDIFIDALPALGSAWAQILQPIVIGYLVLGVCMGLAIGVFPGLGGIAGLSLLLPFMFDQKKKMLQAECLVVCLVEWAAWVEWVEWECNPTLF